MIRNRFIELGEKAPNLDDEEADMHNIESYEEDTPETPIRYKRESFLQIKYNIQGTYDVFFLTANY